MQARSDSARSTNGARLGAMLAARWWNLVLRGSLAILIGAAIFLWPDVSIDVLDLFLGVWLFADGATMAFGLVAYRKRLQMLDATIGLGIGSVILLASWTSGVALFGAVAAWAIVRAIALLSLAVELRTAHRSGWLLGATGVLTLVFGALLLVKVSDTAFVADLTAGFAILSGFSYAVLGFWIEREDAFARDDDLTGPNLPRL